ncbi:MAG: methionyl-tRNA formyltransferase [Erysipelotrichaceae bacterium]|nr:methionyl-tRNA formyltransferase [Erysipelotrichaceae bacterium]
MEGYKQRIVFMGTPEFASNILKGLYEAGFNIVGVVSQPDKEVGRKRILQPSPVKQLAIELGLPVVTPVKIRNDYEEVLSFDPELIITAAYGQIVPKAILDYPKYKCINTHGTLLPKYRGGAPIQRAIINGEKETGMSIMYMNEKMDEGDILYQKSLPIDIHDTNADLFHKLSDLALEMLLEFLPRLFEGDFTPIKQNHEEATYAYNLDKEIEHISFNDDVLKVYDHIRGLLDNPGCYFMMKDRKYKIEKCFFEYDDKVDPNTFVGLEDDYLRFDCNNGYIKVYMIKPEGKNSMDGKSFYNGAGRNLTGEKLG